MAKLANPIPTEAKAIRILNHLIKEYGAAKDFRGQSNPYSNYQLVYASMSTANGERLKQDLATQGWVLNHNGVLEAFHHCVHVYERPNSAAQLKIWDATADMPIVQVLIVGAKRAKLSSLPYYD